MQRRLPLQAGGRVSDTMTRSRRHHDSLSSDVKGFLYAKESEGLSPVTIAGYAGALDLFLRAGQELGIPVVADDVTASDIRAFLSWLRYRGNTPVSINDRLRVLRAFFSFLVAEGQLVVSPCKTVKLLPEPEQEPRVLNDQQIADLFTLCNERTVSTFRAKAKCARDLAMTMLMLDAALRAGDVVSLDLADIDLEGRGLVIRSGKRQKQARLGFGKAARAALWRYVKNYRGDKPGPLFLSERGGRLDRHSLIKIYHKLAARTDWPDKRCHPHMFRHTAAYRLYRHTRDIGAVKRLLRHGTFEMTWRYVRMVEQDDALEIYQGDSPVDELLSGGLYGSANYAR